MKIRFEAAFEDSDMLYEKPVPAARTIPEWYREMPRTTDGKQPMVSEDGKRVNLTIKSCSPFLDSITSGYVLTLPCDVQIIKKEDGEILFNWLVDVEEVVSGHLPEQVPANFAPTSSLEPLKWKAGWKVVTPKGYSTLFTHPLNRHDLPFYTLSGVVETDRYNLQTEFPFVFHDKFLQIDEPMVLKRGIPIVQAIPFKRDDWVSEYGHFDAVQYNRDRFQLRSQLFKSYKNKFWVNKKYF